MRIGRNKMSIKAKKSMVIIGTRRVRKRHGPIHSKKKSRILRRSLPTSGSGRSISVASFSTWP